MKYLLHTTMIALLMILSNNVQAQQQRLDDIQAMLKQNPEIIESVYQSIKQYQQQQASVSDILRRVHDSDGYPTFGNPEADIDQQVVVFTDYNCPYCKRLEPSLERLLEEHPELQVVNVIVPLRQQQLEGIETNSARFALRVWQQAPDKFKQVHDLLMAKNGMHTAESLRHIAQRTGTSAQLGTDDRVEDAIRANYQLFTSAGLRGTPGTLIGNDIIPGLVPYDNLLEVAKANLRLTP